MLKQSPSRNQRSKGFKVKHALQIFLLLAICIWLLYQMKRSHDKKNAYDEESSSEVLGKMQSGGELIKLGRRDLRPLVKDASFTVTKRDGKEEEGEIDVRDGERAEEEAEDLIDEEDREREEGSEEDKGIDFEDVNFLEDQSEIEEGKSDLQEAREEHYRDDEDVESDAVQDIQGITRSLRKVEVEKVESADDEVERETEMYYAKNSKAKALGSENASSTYSGYPLIMDEGNELSKLRNGSLLLVVKDTNRNGTKLNLASNGRDSYLQTAVEPRNEDLGATSVRTYSDSTLSTIENSDSDGSLSTVSHATLQLDGAEKSASTATTDENAVSSGESETNGGLYNGEESSLTSTTKGNSDAVDDEEEEEEEKSIDSSNLSHPEQDQEVTSIMDGL